jgi:hypothetical protein
MVRPPGLEFPTTFETERSSRFPTTSEVDAIAGSVAGIHHSPLVKTSENEVL